MVTIALRLNEITLKSDHAVCHGTFEAGGQVPPYSCQFALSRQDANALEPGKVYSIRIEEKTTES